MARSPAANHDPDGTRSGIRKVIPCVLVLLSALLAAGCEKDPTGPSGSPPPFEAIFFTSANSAAKDIVAVFPSGDQYDLWGNFSSNSPQNFRPKWSADGSKIAFVSKAARGTGEICMVDADGTNFVEITTDREMDFDPTWIPGTGQIAFVRTYPSSGWGIFANNRILKTSIAGGPTQTLTGSGLSPREPAWSPDGARVAFTGSVPGPLLFGIYVAKGDGTEAAMVTDSLGGVSPAWSPDGSRIAFARIAPQAAGIYVMGANGADLKQLTFFNLDRDPAWSPDGSRIAFARGGELFIMNADGSDVAQITSTIYNESDPDWSPDGTRIAYTYERPDRELKEVRVIGADGTNPRTLIPGKADDMQAAWSRDTAKMAFASDRYGDFEIFIDAIADVEDRRLTSSLGDDTEPTWSGDGGSLAFTSDRDGNREIYRISQSGAGATRLTNDPNRDESPAWSPSGEQIVFVSDRDGNLEIYVMNADGSNVRRLTTSDADDTGPSWSPDGSRIAFASTRGGNSDIYVMNADGTGVVRLTTDPGDDRDPAWSPDGASLLFVGTQGGEPWISRMGVDGSGISRISQGGDPAWRIQTFTP